MIPAVTVHGVRLRKLSIIRKSRSSIRYTKNFFIHFFRASEGMLSRWLRLHSQSHQFAQSPSVGILVFKRT
jgi:hypothetical protein